jgi:hypothetical protein
VKDLTCYDVIPWEVRVERDIRADGSIYYVARHPEFGQISGPLGTGATPEEALVDLGEARQSDRPHARARRSHSRAAAP